MQNRVPEFARELVFLPLYLEELRKHFVGRRGIIVRLVIVVARAIRVPRDFFERRLLMPLRREVGAVIELIWLILFLDYLLRRFFNLWVGFRFGRGLILGWVLLKVGKNFFL